MTTPAEILAAYKRHEEAAGGYAFADIRQCLCDTAEECGVSVEAAREMLLETPLFAGSVGRG